MKLELRSPRDAASTAREPSHQAAASPAPAADPRPLIVVIEDEALILRLIVEALEEAGFAPRAASTASDGRSLLEAAGASLFALVTDVNLGGSTDSWALAELARRNAPDAAVVYMTGGGGEAWATRGVAGSRLFNKPFRLEDLTNHLCALVQPRGEPQPTARAALAPHRQRPPGSHA